MTARSVSMGAPFRWLMKALDVGRRQPGALFGGFALLLLVALVPSVLQLAGQRLFAAAPAALLTVYAVSVVLSLVLVPPLLGSAFRLLHACESGQPASATDIFHGYRDLGFGLRMLLTMLLAAAVYVLLFGLLFVALPGKEFFAELIVRAAATPPGGQPDMSGMPPFPPGFLLWLLGAMLGVLVLTNAYMLAFARAALNRQGPVAALLDGLRATLKNLLPFLLIAIVVAIVGFIALMIFALVVGLVFGLLAAVSLGLALVVAVPIYLALMLVLYVVMFGYYYNAWHDLFGEPVLLEPNDALVA